MDCSAKTAIPPGGVTYDWTLTLPVDYPAPLPARSGTGASVNVEAKVPGIYSCAFVAKPTRTDCPPANLNLGSKDAEAVDIQSLVWAEFAAESTPLTTCPNNGGLRIFPGKRFAVDPSANIRQKVKLKATVSPIKGAAPSNFGFLTLTTRLTRTIRRCRTSKSLTATHRVRTTEVPAG